MTIDIGGTKTLIAIFNNTGTITEQIKFPTAQEYDQFKIDLATNVEKLATKELVAAAVAAPGKIDHERGLMIVGGNLPWQNVPIQGDVQTLLTIPCVLENDAKTAALAEAQTVIEQYRKVAYLTISTGVGLGVCIDGVLDPGLLDTEPGRMPLQYEQAMLPWEDIASGKALVARTGMKASDLDDLAAWDHHALQIAKGLICVLAIVQPDVVVIGGGVGNHLDKFKPFLDKHLNDLKNPSIPIPAIIESARPEEAVIYGCYELARQIKT